MPLSRRSPRTSGRRTSTIPNILEHLETRCLLSAGIPTTVNLGKAARGPATVDRSGKGSTLNSAPPPVNEPADIVWTNRASTTTGGAADTDGFGATFGTSAPIARGVIDAVIVSFERMIGSFNYPNAGQKFNLSLSMSGSGFGAGASASGNSGGKPTNGSISMGKGNNSANVNDDNGWFLDPTPFDNSEFTGTIQNPFTGDAQSGSPALNRGDFFTVAGAEITHAMGLF